VAALLGLAGDADVIARRRLVRLDGQPSELVTWWVPASLADGTDLDGDATMREGVRAHLARRKGVRIDRSCGGLALRAWPYSLYGHRLGLL
jgi:DNA-binding GntR family transcriptional regulator